MNAISRCCTHLKITCLPNMISYASSSSRVLSHAVVRLNIHLVTLIIYIWNKVAYT